QEQHVEKNVHEIAVHEGISQQPPDLAMANGISIQLHDFRKRLPFLPVNRYWVERIVSLRLLNNGRKQLQNIATNVDQDQPFADLAPFHEGAQVAGTFAAIIITVVDSHGTVSRRHYTANST